MKFKRSEMRIQLGGGFQPPMATWEVSGTGLPVIRVRARMSGEAIRRARERNSGYCMAWAVEED